MKLKSLIYVILLYIFPTKLCKLSFKHNDSLVNSYVVHKYMKATLLKITQIGDSAKKSHKQISQINEGSTHFKSLNSNFMKWTESSTS